MPTIQCLSSSAKTQCKKEGSGKISIQVSMKFKSTKKLGEKWTYRINCKVEGHQFISVERKCIKCGQWRNIYSIVSGVQIYKEVT